MHHPILINRPPHYQLLTSSDGHLLPKIRKGIQLDEIPSKQQPHRTGKFFPSEEHSCQAASFDTIRPPLTDGSLDTYAYLFRRGAECVVRSIVALGKTFSSTASAAALQFDPWVTYDRSIMTAHAYHLSHAHAKEPVKKTVSPGRTGITLPLSANFSSGHQ